MALGLLEPNYAQAQQVAPDDKRLRTERIEFNGPNGPVKAYTARPQQDGTPTRSPACW